MSTRASSLPSHVAGNIAANTSPRPSPTAKRAREEEICDEEAAPKRRLQCLQGLAAHYICPITQSLLVNPVLAEDGHVYEADAVAKWLNVKRRSPKTNMHMGRRLIECHVVRQSVGEIVESGVIEDDAAAEWHLETGRLQAVDTVPGGTTGALAHFRAAEGLGSAEAGTMASVLTEGLEIRAKVSEFHNRAEESGLSKDWIDSVLGVGQPLGQEQAGEEQDARAHFDSAMAQRRALHAQRSPPRMYERQDAARRAMTLTHLGTQGPSSEGDGNEREDWGHVLGHNAHIDYEARMRDLRAQGNPGDDTEDTVTHTPVEGFRPGSMRTVRVCACVGVCVCGSAAEFRRRVQRGQRPRRRRDDG